MSVAGRWKIIALILSICCVALAVRVFDLGITHTYLKESEESSARHIKLLTGLAEVGWRGLSEEQVMSRLRAYVASQPNSSLVLKQDSKANTIYLEGMRFEFRNGKLERIAAQ